MTVDQLLDQANITVDQALENAEHYGSVEVAKLMAGEVEFLPMMLKTQGV